MIICLYKKKCVVIPNILNSVPQFILAHHLCLCIFTNYVCGRTDIPQYESTTLYANMSQLTDTISELQNSHTHARHVESVSYHVIYLQIRFVCGLIDLYAEHVTMTVNTLCVHSLNGRKI